METVFPDRLLGAFSFARWPGKRLRPAHRHIHVGRIEFNETCPARRALTRDQCCSRAAKPVQHNGSPFAAVANSAIDQLNRLHRRMQVVAERLVNKPDIPLTAIPAPMVARAFAPAVQDRFVLPVIIGPAQCECQFRFTAKLRFKSHIARWRNNLPSRTTSGERRGYGDGQSEDDYKRLVSHRIHPNRSGLVDPAAVRTPPSEWMPPT